MIECTWYKPAKLYVIDINGITKFGITINFKARVRRYKKDFPDLPFQVVRLFDFEKRWQAELVEQLMSRRLKNWLFKGRYEWVINLPIQHVVDCYYQTRRAVEKEMDHYSTYHWTGSRRYG